MLLPGDAVAWCCAVQQALMAANWPSKLQGHARSCLRVNEEMEQLFQCGAHPKSAVLLIGTCLPCIALLCLTAHQLGWGCSWNPLRLSGQWPCVTGKQTDCSYASCCMIGCHTGIDAGMNWLLIPCGTHEQLACMQELCFHGPLISRVGAVAPHPACVTGHPGQCFG